MAWHDTFSDADAVELAFSGSGFGNRTLAAVCAKVGVPLETAAALLVEQGIQATPDQSLKQIAKDRKVAPLEVLKVLVLPQYQPNDS